MTVMRLGAYLVLASWIGTLAQVQWENLLDGLAAWPYLAVPTLLVLGVIGVVVLLVRNDLQKGRLLR